MNEVDQATAVPGFVMIDDNALAAAAMERRFTGSSEIRWLGWAEDDEERAVRLVRERAPEVVLLDVDMPRVDTFALLGRLVAECPRAAVVMFSGHDRPGLVDMALDRGAAGYIHKDEPTATIADLMRRAARGECVLSPLTARAYMRGDSEERREG